MTEFPDQYDDLLSVSDRMVSRAVDFSFDGNPRALMEVETSHGTKRAIYTVFAYIGYTPREMILALTDDILRGISLARAARPDKRLCIVWRRHFDMHISEHNEDDPYPEKPKYVVSARFDVIDEDWERVNITGFCESTHQEGTPYKEIQPKPTKILQEKDES